MVEAGCVRQSWRAHFACRVHTFVNALGPADLCRKEFRHDTYEYVRHMEACTDPVNVGTDFKVLMVNVSPRP